MDIAPPALESRQVRDLGSPKLGNSHANQLFVEIRGFRRVISNFGAEGCYLK